MDDDKSPSFVRACFGSALWFGRLASGGGDGDCFGVRERGS